MRLAAFVVTGLLPLPAAAQLAVDQAEVFLDPRTPGRGVVSFTVTNEGDRVTEAAIYLGDWDRRENGEHRFLPSGTLPRSCARYVRVFPLALRLPARASQAVRIGLEGADSLAAACWSVIFVESRGPQKSGGRQISYVTRIGVKVYVVPPGLPKDGEVTDMAVRQTGRRDVEVAFENTGGVPLWVHGSIEFRRSDNSVAASDTLPEFPVLPGAVRRVQASLPRLARGRYLALALLDFGGAEVAAGQVQVEAP